jgi:CheY-like chemotaxis protein
MQSATQRRSTVTEQTPGASERSFPVVLCVDDESNPLRIRQYVLQKAGFKVLTAESGLNALKVLASSAVDIVVSDHLMPDMTGAQLVGKVKALRPELPFVLLSGVNELPEGAELADAFLSKLEGPEAMIGKIRQLLR